jgi:hypothetical protein
MLTVFHDYCRILEAVFFESPSSRKELNMRTSKAVLALWPSLWALCTPAEGFRGGADPGSGGIQGMGGITGIGIDDGSGGSSGGDGTGGAIDPGATPGNGAGGAGRGGAGAGGAVDAAVDRPQTSGSGGARDTGGEAGTADARDLSAELPTVLAYQDPCLPARWTATASLQGAVAISAIDGDPVTMWQTTAPQQGTESFQIDLGGTVILNQVVLDNTAGNQTDYPRGYRITASTDGTNFTTVAGTTAAGSAGAVTTINFPAVTVRALRVLQTGADGTYWWSIHELRLGCQTLQAPPEGAFDPLDPGRWKATASVSMSGSPPASAIDDNFGTRWTSGVRQQGNEWFLVDLGAATMVSEVWLTTRMSPDYFPAQYSVEMSADNQTFTSAATGTGQATVTKIKFGQRWARYVRIRQTGTTTSSFWAIDQLAIRP